MFLVGIQALIFYSRIGKGWGILSNTPVFHCNGCRDSQAVFSWLLVSSGRFLDSDDLLRTWIEVAESYWRQFTGRHIIVSPA